MDVKNDAGMTVRTLLMNVHLCRQTREHQAVLCASGAMSALASLLTLSTGNEKVS